MIFLLSWSDCWAGPGRAHSGQEGLVAEVGGRVVGRTDMMKKPRGQGGGSCDL